MVSQESCILVLWTKAISALEGLRMKRYGICNRTNKTVFYYLCSNHAQFLYFLKRENQNIWTNYIIHLIIFCYSFPVVIPITIQGETWNFEKVYGTVLVPCTGVSSPMW